MFYKEEKVLEKKFSFTNVDSRIPGGRVLVVDDLEINLYVMREMLAPYGLQVDTAESGSQAIELAKNNDYDVVFMDHLIPDMDGVEAAAAIKNDPHRNIETSVRNLPIIAMTANDLRGVKEFFLEHGFDDYLSKPIDPQELDEVLAKWVGKKIKNEELGVRKENQTSNSTIAAAMEEHRIDMLNHYRVSFNVIPESDWPEKFDPAYFKRFTALVESLNTAAMTVDLQKQAAVLIEAGRCGNILKIKETLPAFYEVLFQKETEQKRKPEDKLQVILSKLKNAILAGETETVEAIMGELGAVNLTSYKRELYFLLYDFLLTGETEKAVGAISLAIRLGEKLPRNE